MLNRIDIWLGIDFSATGDKAFCSAFLSGSFVGAANDMPLLVLLGLCITRPEPTQLFRCSQGCI